MTDKKCGECSLCCLMTHTPEFRRPVGVWCQHCKQGEGCTIYTVRPESCVNYKCMWLMEDWPEFLRPDKCGVLFDVLRNHKTVVAITARPGAWREEPAYNTILHLLKEDRGVYAVDGEEKNLLVPEGRTPEQVWYDLMKAVKELGLT